MENCLPNTRANARGEHVYSRSCSSSSTAEIVSSSFFSFLFPDPSHVIITMLRTFLPFVAGLNKTPSWGKRRMQGCSAKQTPSLPFRLVRSDSNPKWGKQGGFQEETNSAPCSAQRQQTPIIIAFFSHVRSYSTQA